MVLYVDPKDPNLDLSKYNSEDLVSAVLVQPNPDIKEESATFDQLVEAEDRIKTVLNEEQWSRRCGSSKVKPYSSLSAIEKAEFDQAFRNRRKTRENLGRIQDHKFLKNFNFENDQTEPPPGPPKHGAERTRNGQVGSIFKEELVASEENRRMSEQLVRVLDTLNVNGETANSQLLELQESNIRLGSQAVEAKNQAKTAQGFAVATAILAALSFVVAGIALLKPVNIDQPPNRPVPVQIVESTKK